MKTIEIKDFIRILILELNRERESYVYYVDSYNNEYFYIDEFGRLATYQNIYQKFPLRFHKVLLLDKANIEQLEKEIYTLYKRLTFKIPRAKKNITYYFINSSFEVIEVEEENVYFDNTLYDKFNYFTSKEEAEKYARKLQQFLIESRKEEYIKGE